MKHFIFACCLLTCGFQYAPIIHAQPYSIPVDDAPELARLGAYSVGWKTLSISAPNQPDLARMIKTVGISSTADRNIKVEVWYPTKVVAGVAAGAKPARYESSLPSRNADKRVSFSTVGIAVKDALPLNDQRFPLVIVSHGFAGWGTFMTYLTENLASKGYVVAAIDHADASFSGAIGFALSFSGTVALRSRDQQNVIAYLTGLASSQDALGRAINADVVGVIGYSMGGFGALTTAGAGYDLTSATFKQIPDKVMTALSHGNAAYELARPKQIKAVVLIAPWGGQPTNRAWSRQSLENIRAPALFVSGDQDDIVDYKDGVSYLFKSMKSAERYMLVFQNARHNTGGNPSPPEAAGDFSTREYFDEPVWRKDRLMAINQHFITAFLDLHLKGMADRRDFLDLPTVSSNDARWNVGFGKTTGGDFANGRNESAGYWRGFQRRWALGLEMHRKKSGE